MVEEGTANAKELDQTPTWAVASVCAVIVLISILLEKVLHHIGEWFTKRRKKAMFEALEKVKAELMVLGFISLLLTFGQSYISKICITEKAADTMLPCRFHETTIEPETSEKPAAEHRRRLLWNTMGDLNSKRRVLSGGAAASCPHGKVPLISINGLHQLHIFIFFLAVFHVLYSAITMTLGRAKIRGWKEWEKESDFQSSNDQRFRFSHETSFVRQHTSFWNKIPVSFYLRSFFHQFFSSVRKADYLAMRQGFITVHLAPGTKFDFRKYIKRSLEDDFKVVVGISPTLWASAVICLLINVQGWHMMFWIALVPLLIILAVGTKLQAIITTMALEIKERHAVVQGMPVVQLNDHHFWFNSPHMFLFLIHFTLFQNAFQIIYFLWIWYEFGLSSCFHDDIKLVIIRICLGIGVQVLCSYITLPLYALVSQMGSHMKKTIFDEQTSKALMKWTQAAKKKNVKDDSPSQSPATSPKGTPKASAGIPLHRFKTPGQPGLASVPSRRRTHSGDMTDIDLDAPAPPIAANLNPGTNYTDLLTGSTDHQVNVEEIRQDGPHL